MILFFQRLKRKLIEEGRFKSYILYALGEIIIIITGILVAVQINNRNSLKISDEIFKLQLVNFYYDLMLVKGNVMMGNILMESQISYIDTLLAKDNSTKDYELPYLIYIMDNRFFTLNTVINTDFEQNSMRSDEAKQTLINNINKYISLHEIFKPHGNYGGYIHMALKDFNVPAFDYSYFDYINIYSIDQFLTTIDTGYYSREEIKKVKECLTTPFIKNLLKTNKVFIKRDIQNANTLLTEIKKLEGEIINYYTDILQYKTVGIIGSSLPDGWEKSFPMQKNQEEAGIWEAFLDLKEGFVKFRTNDSWTINWGGKSFPHGNCIPNGLNIPVHEGKYHVILNLKTQEYFFEKIEK